MVALMTELLHLSGTEKVLEIGTGCGYQTAILAELCKFVYSIERIAELASRAKALLAEFGYTNVFIKNADGTLGWEEAAPFDRIIITAAAADIPKPLWEQLAQGGSMVYPKGNFLQQELMVASKLNNAVELERVCGCTFVPLIGKYGLKNG